MSAMDTRRQSGLWDQNPQTGEFERRGPSGPYQYYKPPNTSEKRRSYSERSAAQTTNMDDAYRAATQNGLERSTSVKHGKTYDSEPAIAASSLQHTGGHDLTDGLHHPQDQNATPKHVDQVDSLSRDSHRRDLIDGVDTGEHDIQEQAEGGSSEAQHHDEYDDEDVPENLRRKAWSPEPESPIVPDKTAPARHASNASERIRRGSVPDRSPLQHLEAKLGDMGKEEKRARMEKAEIRARENNPELFQDVPTRGESVRHEKPRAVSDIYRRRDEFADHERRTMSNGSQKHRRRESGNEKFYRATNDLQTGLANHGSPYTSTHARYSQDSRQQTRGLSSGSAFEDDAAARGKAAHERRKKEALAATAAAQFSHQPDTGKASANAAGGRRITPSWGPSAGVPASPASSRDSEEVHRTQSKWLPKQSPDQPSQIEATQQPQRDERLKDNASAGKPLLQENRLGATHKDNNSSLAPLEPDIVSREDVKTGPETAVPYSIPPQTAAARQAKERVSFAPDVVDAHERDPTSGHHRLRDMFTGHHIQARGYQSSVAPLEEWKGAKPVRLAAADLVLDDAVAGAQRESAKDSAWWESSGRHHHNGVSAMESEPYEEKATSFEPALYLRCGPLLRFTGLGKDAGIATVWRGSIMILTEDAASDLEEAPSLRLFAQDMTLYQPPMTTEYHTTDDHSEHGETVQHHEDDAITGQMKISRIGRPIYVRSVHDIEHDVDLSRQENKNGLFTAVAPTANLRESSADQTKVQRRHNPSRTHGRDGEKLHRYQEINAHRLHSEHGCTFWRFNIEIELGLKQTRIAYRINNGPAVGFWIPARGQSMTAMFHSCNGFSLSVDPNTFCGPDPLWRDVLNRHQRHPFHVMIGGGDQIYNDAAIRETTHFKAWLQIKNPEHKHHADFTVEMQEELETYFFNRYAMWFSQGLFGMANAQIPMVNIYDDHDIIDGFGSYPHHFMSSPVFTGLGAIAFKYYMLFQHQSLPTETTQDEPSWLLGASPGPYINELNRSVFVWLGDKTALLALDCRTERMRDDIISQESYDIIFDRCRKELVKGDAKHLLVLLGVPIAYPRLVFLENILTSRVMDPIKALGRTGALGGFVNKFDGGVEILDDLDDHWTAKHHKGERNWFIQELQELAADRSVRITILGGDVHLGAVGQFYSNKTLGLPKDKDHRYMPNIISSAIVNTPPPPMMADVLNRRNKVHHLDRETDEDMIPMFEHDVNGSRRNNKRLLPRRNYAIIREYMPGSTPPSTPPPERDSAFADDNMMDDQNSGVVHDRSYPPGSMNVRSVSGRSPGGLLRRLSLRGRNPPPTFDPVRPRPLSFAGQSEQNDFSAVQSNHSLTTGSESQRPIHTFQRRPTNLSIKEARKAAAKGGPDDAEFAGHIDLEGGLDISLCMEVDQHDPAGRTVPYRLLVPALWYEGAGDKNTLTLPARRPSLFKRMTTGRRAKAQQPHGGDFDDDQIYDDFDGTGGVCRLEIGPHGQVRAGNSGNMQAMSAGAGHGTDYEDVEASDPPHQAYPTGYDLRSPPIGRGLQSTQQHQSADKLHSQLLQSAAHQQHGYNTDSLTPSREDLSISDNIHEGQEQYPEDSRRYSKVEQFFGIGEDAMPRNSGRAGVLKKSNTTGTKTRSWMPWKRGGSLRGWPGEQH